MSPEQRKIIQSIVDGMYERFFQIVKKNRSKMSEQKLRELADGRIFTADQAFREGFVDKIGYTEDAINYLMARPEYRKSAGNDRPRIITYTATKKNIKNVYQVSERMIDPDTIQNILKLLNSRDETKFMYLWKL
jgi:protease-4